MGWFAEAIAAATGQAPLREAARARRRADRSTRRRVRRLVDTGAAAGTVADAELAVALARDRQRVERQAGRKTWVFFFVMVMAWLAFAIGWLIDGQLILGVAFSFAFAFGVRMLVQHQRRRGCAVRAEAVNRALLIEAGAPYTGETEELERPPVWLVAVGVVITFVYYVTFFGTFMRLVDSEPVTVTGVLGSGLAFGILMSVANLTWVRRRNLSASRAG